MNNIFLRASDPKQYDQEGIAWTAETGINSPVRYFIWKFLKEYDWSGKSVLDVGSGSGWLLNEIKKVGGNRVVGIEPSKRNFEVARKMFPELEIINTTIEVYNGSQKFDVVVTVLSLSHVADLKNVFNIFLRSLNTNGDLIIVTMDYNYYKTPRFGYNLEIEEIDNETYAILINGRFGQLADIVRTADRYIAEAQSLGFVQVETIPMKPDEELVNKMPIFKEVENYNLFNLIKFRKSSNFVP